MERILATILVALVYFAIWAIPYWWYQDDKKRRKGW